MSDSSSITNESSICAYALAVAGHKKALLFDISNGRLLKPMQSGGRGLRELTSITTGCDDDIRALVPVFYQVRTLRLTSEKCGRLYIEMEDLLSGCRRPCVVDIKLGFSLYTYKKSKIKYELMKVKKSLKHIVFLFGATTPCHVTSLLLSDRTATAVSKRDGFLILGMRLHDRNGRAVMHSRYANGLRQWYSPCTALQPFFNAGLTGQDRVLCTQLIIDQLTDLENWLCRQIEWRFMGVSVLMLYDVSDTGQLKANVRIIDFAHTTRQTEQYKQHSKAMQVDLIDTTARQCVRNLILALEQTRAKLIHSTDTDQLQNAH